MPRYRFTCDPCAQDQEVYCERAARTEPKFCPLCGAALRQLPPLRVFVNVDALDFVTSDITGSPVRIQTKTQLNKLCEENGCRRVSSDEVGHNKQKSIEEIARSAGVGDLKSDCEKTAQALGVPLELPKDPKERKKVVKRTNELLTASA
ncbi:MAG: zinc ribbon domain-containing protein [Candidatus Hydrogenedentes bacterium]|nr:zinc ribbon domain-containing protein [Candidatus Hydrogenedentota bacterium]